MRLRSILADEEGVSLLGVLIALVITSMTGLLIAQGFTLVDRLSARQERYGTIIAAEIDALATFARLIAEAEPPFPNRAETTFDGRADALSFMLRPGVLAGGAPLRADILYERTTEELVLRVLEDPGEAEADRIVLLRNVAALAFEYHRSVGAEGSEVTNSWQSRKRLPNLIVARIRRSGSGREIEVNVELQRRYSTACLIFGWADCLKADL